MHQSLNIIVIFNVWFIWTIAIIFSNFGVVIYITFRFWTCFSSSGNSRVSIFFILIGLLLSLLIGDVLLFFLVLAIRVRAGLCLLACWSEFLICIVTVAYIFMVLILLGRLQHPFRFWLELDFAGCLCSLVSSPNSTEPHALVHILEHCILPWVWHPTAKCVVHNVMLCYVNKFQLSPIVNWNV